MSPCGTEQTLDLIKLALTDTHMHIMWCVPAKHKYTETDTQADQQSTRWTTDHFPFEMYRGGHEAHTVDLTSSTFCIHNRAEACGKIQARHCFGLPSCPKVNHHAKLRLRIQTTAALVKRLAIFLKHLLLNSWHTHRGWGTGAGSLSKNTKPNESSLQS